MAKQNNIETKDNFKLECILSILNHHPYSTFFVGAESGNALINRFNYLFETELLPAYKESKDKELFISASKLVLSREGLNFRVFSINSLIDSLLNHA